MSAYKRVQNILPAILSIVFALLAWQLTVQWTQLPRFILPAPLDVWSRFLKALSDGSLLYHTGITLAEIVLGLLVGITFATMMGYALAKSRSLEKILSPYLVASQAIPVVAIAPLAGHLAGGWDSLEGGHLRVDRVLPRFGEYRRWRARRPAALYDLMNSIRATRWQILLKLEIPASLPIMLGGLRIGATLSVIGAIVGELVDAEQGLGFLLQLGDFQYDTSMVFVAVFMLIALALSMYGVVTLLERKFLKWQK